MKVTFPFTMVLAFILFCNHVYRAAYPQEAHLYVMWVTDHRNKFLSAKQETVELWHLFAGGGYTKKYGCN